MRPHGTTSGQDYSKSKYLWMNIIIVYSCIYMHIIHIYIYNIYIYSYTWNIMEYLLFEWNGFLPAHSWHSKSNIFLRMFALQSVDGLACVEWTFPQRCFKEQRVVMFLGPWWHHGLDLEFLAKPRSLYDFQSYANFDLCRWPLSTVLAASHDAIPKNEHLKACKSVGCRPYI